MLELLVAVAILAIVMGAVGFSLVTSTAVVQTSREVSLASDAAQSALAELWTVPFDEIYRRYNEVGADDPGGAGTAPGAAFDVLGLDPVPGDPDGRVGRIIFPGDGKVLREDGNDPVLGMPRDLNLDGATDAADHALDYTHLPVRVRIDWTGKSGARNLELVTTLTEL